MGNLQENNYHNLKIKVNRDEYWDFFVNKDNFSPYSYSMNNMYDRCLISYIDLSLPGSYDNENNVYSSPDYKWESAYTEENYTLYNIGYTGVDNGLIRFRRDRVSNKEFSDLYQNSQYSPNTESFVLHPVSGSTLKYGYPLEINDGVMKLNGGFVQGFFKTECDKYWILPSSMEYDTPWEFEFVLNKCDMETESTLNDSHPDNKGIFFYIGTRAENKWIYLYDNHYDGEECFTLSPDDYVEGGEIDPKTYLISNFEDLDVEFVDDFNLDDYTDYNYYKEEYYRYNCDDIIDGLFDYADIPQKPKIIDETLPHTTVSCNCCQKESHTLQSYRFHRYCQCCSCGCGCVRPSKSSTSKNGCLTECDIFGDDYIGDFEGMDDGTQYLEPELDISDFEFLTEGGLNIRVSNEFSFDTDNKFIFFNRTCTGFTVNNWNEGDKVTYIGKKSNFKENLFILMNRTCTGYTVNNINEYIDNNNNTYDYFYDDIYNNALAFRITDDGEIGYRYLSYDCDKEGEDKTDIIEGYSFKNVISDCEWHTIHVRVMPQMSEMRLFFYVDGKLVYITRSMPKLNLHALKEAYEKQEGVPYNISIGGGTQGLAETVLPNYMMDNDRMYPLEKYFAGSFIGYFKSFKFYNCGMEYLNIFGNYNFERRRYL